MTLGYVYCTNVLNENTKGQQSDLKPTAKMFQEMAVLTNKKDI